MDRNSVKRADLFPRRTGFYQQLVRIIGEIGAYLFGHCLGLKGRQCVPTSSTYGALSALPQIEAGSATGLIPFEIP